MDKDSAAQVPASRKSKNALVKTHKAHLKTLGSDPDADRPVKQPILEDGYQASTKSIRDLDIMPLADLKGETHHRGQGLVVRTIAPPYRGAGTVTVVEDEYGNADKLAIYNQSEASILSNLPEGCIVAVKEPYYQHNGDDSDYMICVDHPSDVIMLRFNDPIIPAAWRADAEQAMTKSAAEWKSAADSAFIQRDFPTAIFCYTEALEMAEAGSFRAGIHAKRAGTNLMLGRYDAAMADATASLAGKSSDWRAHLTAAKAAYGLCDYKTSRDSLVAALSFIADGDGARAGLEHEYERCLARVEEEESGNYDFAAMHASLSAQHVNLDHGSFVIRTAVANSPHHGNGLFAVQRIAAGDIVFVEKAAFMPNQYEPERASAALYATSVRALTDNPSLAGDILPLYGGNYVRTGGEGTVVDGVPVVDVFLAESIRLKNCFSAPRATVDNTRPAAAQDRMAKGMWVRASYLNHSCVPNTMRSFLGDMFISRAVRDIEAGEELFQQYVPVKADIAARQEQLESGWGFRCGCPLCTGEARSADAAHQRRMEVLRQVEKVARKRRPEREIVPDAAIRTVDRLARQLEDLHEPDVYARLPRLMLIYPTMWLLRAHRGRKNHVKVVQCAANVLRNFGFVLPDDGDAMDMYSQAGRATGAGEPAVALMTIHVVTVLKDAADAHRSLGRRDLADRYEEAARFGYKIITGYENDLAGLNMDEQ